MIDLDPKNLLTLQTLLQRLVPNTPVWAFGSRVTHTAKPYSDLDLVIVGKHRIPQALYYKIKDEMEESDLPFKVDVIDWHRISPSFRTVIQKKYIVLIGQEQYGNTNP